MPTGWMGGREDAGGGLWVVTIAVPSQIRGSYTHPGQYVQVTAGGDKGYFALAGDVGGPAWQLMLRRARVGDDGDGATRAALLDAAPGSPLVLSEARGRGFPSVL